MPSKFTRPLFAVAALSSAVAAQAAHHHSHANTHSHSTSHHAAKPAKAKKPDAPHGTVTVPAGGLKIFCPARSPLLIRKSTQGAGTTVTVVCR